MFLCFIVFVIPTISFDFFMTTYLLFFLKYRFFWGKNWGFMVGILVVARGYDDYGFEFGYLNVVYSVRGLSGPWVWSQNMDSEHFYELHEVASSDHFEILVDLHFQSYEFQIRFAGGLAVWWLSNSVLKN